MNFLYILFYTLLSYTLVVNKQPDVITVTIDPSDVTNSFFTMSGTLTFNTMPDIDPEAFERAVSYMIDSLCAYYNGVLKIYFSCNQEAIFNPCGINPGNGGQSCKSK